ncbi:proline-rich acidic protein 1 isoform X1 [Equus przewalskii]|uniref:Proline-rich acidic protein 1 isoform X1 n=1 Tax=Equus przewalskii TaxID=9798 RepID=A0ABM4QD76_EQUPR|nr:proline-rich acidic protein 1 [Equus caballus]
MSRLLLVTILVAVLLQEAGTASVSQVLFKTKGRGRALEQHTEVVWGARAVEPPEEDDQLTRLLLSLTLSPIQEKQQGTKGRAGTKDILGGLRSPRRGPEPDYDSLYHPPPEEAQEEAGPRSQVLLSRQVLRGPEEDRDHIYHTSGDS